MKPVREIVSREIIDDLWGCGYTIVPRARHPDPFHVPAEIVPQGRSYQWWHLVHDKFWYQRPHGSSGWAPVPASRHDGYFMPAGFVGDIEVNGLGLFEKPKFEVDAERAENAAKAKKMVTDWAEKNSALFEGEVKICNQTKLSELDKVDTVKVGATKSIENITKIPREMTPYIAQIFEERDLIAKKYTEDSDGDNPVSWSIAGEFRRAMDDNPDAPKWPTLNAIILPYAIANIRKRIEENGEAKLGQTSEH